MDKVPKILKKGVEVILGYVKNLPDSSGVYRMLDRGGNVLYVGKAKSLKKRVSSYTNISKLSNRIQRMVVQTAKMEFVNTATEVEALLLEANLIKKLKPKYNILLRDDKSFPYILVRKDHDFPVIVKHRGKRNIKGKYFGPYPSAGAVNKSLVELQKIFMLRNCSDVTFSNRKRPCLQYHIKRCTAPCVGKVSKIEYLEQVKEAVDCLSGKSSIVRGKYVKKMEEASSNMEYEIAALYRDRIKTLTNIQARQDINFSTIKDADVIGIETQSGVSCIQVFFIRAGQNLGNMAFYPKHSEEDSKSDILLSFIPQFYENKVVPPLILVSENIKELELIEKAYGAKISYPIRGGRKIVVDFAVSNAKEALSRRLKERISTKKILQKICDIFEMKEIPRRIEIYDNSHISGTNMVGAMVVANQDGFKKSAYRKFNIKFASACDDYGMMKEVMERRFKGVKKDFPDLLLIDGGQGQFNIVKETLEEMGIWEKMKVVAIAKGVDRNAGREKFFMEGKDMFQLPVNDEVLHYLQRLRDEAHRFAIGSHRVRRNKDISVSKLDEISGIGAKRKKALLLYFGSAKAVEGASLSDLEKVKGVSKSVAEKIYNYFHA